MKAEDVEKKMNNLEKLDIDCYELITHNINLLRQFLHNYIDNFNWYDNVSIGVVDFILSRYTEIFDELSIDQKKKIGLVFMKSLAFTEDGKLQEILSDEKFEFMRIACGFTTEEMLKIKNDFENVIKSVDAENVIIDVKDSKRLQLIQYYIELGRYDLIKIIDGFNNKPLDKELIPVLREYPFEKYGVPKFLVKSSECTEFLDYFSFEDLLENCSIKHKEAKMGSYSEEYEIVKKKIIEKTNKMESLANFELKEIFDDFPIEFQMEIFEKGSFVTTEELYKNGLITNENIINKVKSVISNNNDLDLNHFNFLCNFHLSNYEDNKVLRKTLLENGYIYPLIVNKKIIISENEEEEIIKILSNKEDKRYDKVFRSIKLILEDNLDYLPERLFEYVIDNDLIGDKIYLKTFTNKDLIIKTLQKYKDKVLIDKDRVYEKIDEEIFEVLAETERFDNISNLYSLCKNPTLFLKNVLLKDANIFEKVLKITGNTELKLLLEDTNMFKILMNYDFLSDNILGRIISDRLYMESLLDESHLDLMKPVLLKKYNIAETNYDMAFKFFGKNIIYELDNPNVLKLLSLSSDKLSKILNLLTIKEDFNENDFNGVIIGLCEKIFLNEHNDIASMYTNISLSLNEEEKARRLLTVLKINTLETTLSYINDKYKKNFTSVEDLFNKINNNIFDNKTKEYYLTIVHDLCDKYVEQERANFINYHDYDDKRGDIREHYLFLNEFINGNDRAIIRYLDNLYQNFIYSGIYNDDYKKIFSMIKEDIRNNKYSFKDVELTDKLFKIYLNEYIKKTKKGIKERLIEDYKVKYRFVDSQVEKELEKDILINIDNYKFKKEPLFDYLLGRLKSKNIDEKILKDVIEILKGENPNSNNKKYISSVKNEVNDIINNFETRIYLYYQDGYFDRNFHIEVLDRKNLLKRVPVIKSGVDRLSLFSKIDPDLVNNVLDNDKTYSILEKYISDKKIMSVPSELKTMFDRARITSNYADFYAFINYFIPIIMKETKSAQEKNRDFSLSNLSIVDAFKLSEVFASSSSVYAAILGREEARIIKENKAPFSGIETYKDERLKKAVDYLLECYKREEITIPAFREVYKTQKGKEVEVTVGNFTSPKTLTLGERTEACLRINSNADSLFDFCIKNKNGFHITFENPDTGELISRVSGFRNGNTVFLNELRHSLNIEVSDSELYVMTKKIAERLVEDTKNSTCPIENVVISQDKALEMLKGLPKVELGVKNISYGYRNIYHDVGKFGKDVLLASSDGSTLQKINLDNKNVPTYQVCTSKTRFIKDELLLEDNVIRIDSGIKLLNGADIENLDVIEIKDTLKEGYINDLFYICIDVNNNIISDCIRTDERTTKEYEELLNKVKENLLGGKESGNKQEKHR